MKRSRFESPGNQPDGRSLTKQWKLVGFIPWIAAMFSRLSFLSLLERPSTLRSASPSRVLPETPGVTPSPSLRDLEVGVPGSGNRNGIMKCDPFWGEIKQCEAKI